MEHTVARRFIRMVQGHALAQHDLVGRTVRVRRGRIWLTQHADLRDYFLLPGEEMRIANAGAVVMHALTDAVVEVRTDASARRPRFPAAIARLLRRDRTASTPA